MFDRSQYTAFHGHEPPPGWQEAAPADIHAAFNGERPHIVFLSAPCKGFSGLLGQDQKRHREKYQALNRLTLRGVWLLLEAYKDDPVELLLFENVPLIASRGRHLLDQITELLRAYGYAVAETTHDCGEIGALAQKPQALPAGGPPRPKGAALPVRARKTPPARRGRRVGPDAPAGRPARRAHAPNPLAAVENLGPPGLRRGRKRLAQPEPAGRRERAPARLSGRAGLPRGLHGRQPLGPAHGTAAAGGSGPSNGAFSVADPRFDQSAKWHDGQAYGVRRWDESTGAIAGQQNPCQGAYAVADPRQGWSRVRESTPVTDFTQHAGTVISGSTTGQGGYAVADPRPGIQRSKGDAYLTAGHYGVVPWEQPAGAVAAAAGHDNGRWTVADPRTSGFAPEVEAGEPGAAAMPRTTDKLVSRIHALDGTWHRPFTTLELAALQSPRRSGGAARARRPQRSATGANASATPSPRRRHRHRRRHGPSRCCWRGAGRPSCCGRTPIWVRNVAVGLAVAGGAA